LKNRFCVNHSRQSENSMLSNRGWLGQATSAFSMVAVIAEPISG
jgi:hypothetical protein